TEREAALKKEHDSRLAALHRANEDAMSRLKAEHAQLMEEASTAAASTLEALRDSLTKEHDANLGSLKGALDTLAEAKSQGEASRDARIASLSSDLEAAATERDRAKDALSEKEASLAGAEAN